ncbi:helix-turn-helix transcriptional regulator [Candidatus Aquicultor secundus]|nr:helix-turn-helix transcriptional regulator [Candidatus Aquicultor secundus]
MPNQSYPAWQDKWAEDRESLEYKLEGVILEVTEEILGRMEQLGINKTDLARLLGVNKAAVTKFLRGSENLTLKTLVKVAMALGCDLSVTLPPCGFEARHVYVSRSEAQFSDPSRFLIPYDTTPEVSIEPEESDEGKVA